MSSAFQSLESTKQLRILNAAFKEFTRRDFAQASTNQIVKEAGIGKGMLFYYFQNKQELYAYLIDYALEMVETEFLNKLNTHERDFFKRLQQMTERKLIFLMTYPDAMNFISRVMLDNPEMVKANQLERIRELQTHSYTLMYENIDNSLFRTDMEAEKVFQLIRWTFRGYEEEMTQRFRGKNLEDVTLQPYFDEFLEYIDMLKISFYRGEECEL